MDTSRGVHVGEDVASRSAGNRVANRRYRRHTHDMEAQVGKVTTSEPGVVALPTRPGTRDPGLRRLDRGHISAAGEEPRRPEV